ncbi:MAG: transglycosylase SLT domain-containing protein [Hylemonella sp.]
MQFQAILTSLALALGLALPLAEAAQTKAAARPSQDALITDMAEAYKKLDRRRLSALLPQVRGHVLEPWAAYWELSARLDEASAEEVRQFFQRYAGTYQEDRLRAEWLLLLGKRRDWAAFAAEYPRYRMQDDASIRCYALLLQAQAGEGEVAQQVQELWLAQRDADEGCAAAAEQQLRAERLPPLVVWQRARLGFEQDRPQIARQAVALLNPELVPTLNAIYSQPDRYLQGRVTAIRPHSKELVTLALIRLASQDLEAAARELDKLRWKLQLTQEEISWVWGVIGKRAARQLSDDALGYFAHGNPAHMHHDHLLWRVRAALRARDWVQVQDALAALGEPQLRDPAWIYWRARALLALRAPDAELRARALLRSIASNRGFYEMLALEELGEAITAPPAPQPLTDEELNAARANPGLQRALYAIRIGLRSEGVREWNYTTNLHQRGGMGERELLAAAAIACEQQVWDRCINTSERTRQQIDMAQRFPMPHKQAVLQRTADIGLDPAYVYGLIRQESRFIMDAQSPVGAAGLMQVMPATARWTARKIGMHGFKPHHIKERDTNIAIGTSYLKLVLDAFDGSLPLAAAAYNAGPSRARAWLARTPDEGLEGAIWAENVPFAETRDYVKKVLANTTNYAAVLTGQPQSLKARLGVVGATRLARSAEAEALP